MSNRYSYMADPRFNPPNNDCPECEEPSKTYFIGANTVSDDDGNRVKHTTYTCEHQHEWRLAEVRE